MESGGQRKGTHWGRKPLKKTQNSACKKSKRRKELGCAVIRGQCSPSAIPDTEGESTFVFKRVGERTEENVSFNFTFRRLVRP